MTRDTIPIHRFLPGASRLVYGCMTLGGDWQPTPLTGADRQRAFAALDAAVAGGINVFDHADIYTVGKSESVFGEWLAAQPTRRGDLYLQSKGGIELRDDSNRYLSSADAIVACVEGSLARLGTGWLDLWMLHRPDPLMAVDEIATAFESLHRAGKVRHFGVSNMHAGQLALLRDALGLPVVVNQLELSLGHLAWLDEGVDFNTGPGTTGVARTIDACRRAGVQVQAWSPLARGRFSGRPAGESDRPAAAVVTELAQAHRVSREAIVLAFLLRHPAAIQPVIGSVSPERISACAQALDVTLSRADWYRLYVAARGRPLP